jgi:hypothetical protein
VEIVVIFIVTANLFFSDCRFLGVFIFLDTETSAKSAIEPDPAYSIHTFNFLTYKSPNTKRARIWGFQTVKIAPRHSIWPKNACVVMAK